MEVWHVDLASVGEEITELLSDGERGRAAASLRKPGARLWARSRGVLRALLGGHVDLDPRSLHFTEEAGGKPVLEPEGASSAGTGMHLTEPGLSFNMSHSRGVALYAFSRAGPVGVDVELGGRGQRNREALAARVFGVGPAERLKTLDAERREREFLRMWVRREAALKCMGTGFGARSPAKPEQELWIGELDVPGGAAALALRGAPQELRCRSWTGGTTSRVCKQGARVATGS
ncbi:MAG TPA: 4'-phosphopantetheinyl transferase superfamily protein [Solirubrobacteraceae bacterium]